MENMGDIENMGDMEEITGVFVVASAWTWQQCI
jgi:hypothetical protein